MAKNNIADVNDALSQWANARNHGNLLRVMKAYKESPEAICVSGKTLVIGDEKIEGWYKIGHLPLGTSNGIFTIHPIRINILSLNMALVCGNWKLQKPSSDEVEEGMFTIVLQKIGTNWKIIHEHSS